MLKFVPGTEYYELDLKKSLIKQDRQSLIDSSLVQLPKSLQQNNETLFMSTPEKARLRNETLLKSLQKLNHDIDAHLNKPDDPKFVTLKKNYWDMVNEVLPMWEKELAEYRERKSRENPAIRQDV